MYGVWELFYISYYAGKYNLKIFVNLIIYLNFRYPPFYGKTDKTIMKRVLKGKYAFEG